MPPNNDNNSNKTRQQRGGGRNVLFHYALIFFAIAAAAYCWKTSKSMKTMTAGTKDTKIKKPRVLLNSSKPHHQSSNSSSSKTAESFTAGTEEKLKLKTLNASKPHHHEPSQSSNSSSSSSSSTTKETSTSRETLKNNNPNEDDSKTTSIKALNNNNHNHEDYDNTKPNNKLIILISSFKQFECLYQRIRYFQRYCRHMNVIAAIHVNWFDDQGVPMPNDWRELLSAFNTTDDLNPPPKSDDEIPVIFDSIPNGISQRFQPRNFSANAIFSVDIDMFYSCRVLQWALEVWIQENGFDHDKNQTNNQTTPTMPTAVGFHPRFLPFEGYYRWDLSHRRFSGYTTNTVFITKGGIVHQRYLTDYFDPSLKPLRDEIDARITAEDMLMSVLLMAKGVRIRSLLTNPVENCGLRGCNQAGVTSLAGRTSDHRGPLLNKLRQYFLYNMTDVAARARVDKALKTPLTHGRIVTVDPAIPSNGSEWGYVGNGTFDQPPKLKLRMSIFPYGPCDAGDVHKNVVQETTSSSTKVETTTSMKTRNNNNHNKDDNNTNNNKLIILLSSFKQFECVYRRIRYFQRFCRHMDFIAAIHVNWFDDQGVPMPNDWRELLSAFNTTDDLSYRKSDDEIPVIFDSIPNGISQRFQPRNFSANAIFSVDIDTFYSCRVLRWALEVWIQENGFDDKNQTNHNNQTPAMIPTAVGFHPRFLPLEGYYRWDLSHRPWSGYSANTVFITKGGIVHQRYLNDYFDPSLQHLRDEIDARITAEDMLMSVMLMAKGVRIRSLLTNEVENCGLRVCNQAGVTSLAGRTSNHRGPLLDKIRQHFLNNTTTTDAAARVHKALKTPLTREQHVMVDPAVPSNGSEWGYVGNGTFGLPQKLQMKVHPFPWGRCSAGGGQVHRDAL